MGPWPVAFRVTPVCPCPASLWGDLGLLISGWLWPWLLSLWFGFWMARVLSFLGCYLLRLGLLSD